MKLDTSNPEAFFEYLQETFNAFHTTKVLMTNDRKDMYGEDDDMFKIGRALKMADNHYIHIEYNDNPRCPMIHITYHYNNRLVPYYIDAINADSSEVVRLLHFLMTTLSVLENAIKES